MSKGRMFVKLSIFSVYFITFTLLLTIINKEPITSYITTLKYTNSEVTVKDQLYNELLQYAKQIEQEPINARIDRVWKAIPGLNGVKVDVEKSYPLAKKAGKVTEEHVVLKEIEPEISLEELPPQPIYRGNPNKKMISLMINVAWGTENVKPMLQIFDKYKVKATFFLDGSWLNQNKQTAMMILERGHEIGNHAYSHPDLRKKEKHQIQEELGKTEQLIKELGTRSKVFAPPAGAYDDRTVQIAHQMQMKTIMWTLDTVDWKKPEPQIIINRIVPHLENGALILMHPTASTVAALPIIIQEAKNKDLQIGTVSDLISSTRALSIEPKK